MPETLKEVFKKYDHLGGLLTDPAWMEGASLQWHILAEIWQAIKAHLAEPCYHMGDRVEGDDGQVYRVGLLSESLFED